MSEVVKLNTQNTNPSAHDPVFEKYAAKIGATRALMQEEPLLVRKKNKPMTPGVDLPELERKKPRTGLAIRDNIGLPQIKEPEVVRQFCAAVAAKLLD